MTYDTVLADRIRELLETEPEVSEKAMFGGLAFLVRGHMAVAANSAGHLMVRCPREETDELAARPDVEHMTMSGRSMRGWLLVDPTAIATRDDLGDWVDRAVSYVLTLPAK